MLCAPCLGPHRLGRLATSFQSPPFSEVQLHLMSSLKHSQACSAGQRLLFPQMESLLLLSVPLPIFPRIIPRGLFAPGTKEGKNKSERRPWPQARLRDKACHMDSGRVYIQLRPCGSVLKFRSLVAGRKEDAGRK